MVIFRSYNDLVISFLEYLRLTQPNLDTKPGTVARDLFIDAPSQSLSDLYSQLRNISDLQSLFSTSGQDLVKLVSNFGLSKRSGGFASGVAILTTNNLDTDIIISNKDILSANNGINFKISNTYVMSSTNSNVYRATAIRLREELELAGITDRYAIEVACESVVSGTSGNIGPYSINVHSISGISRVTNLQSFSGGSNAESDDTFRSRILSVFAGSNTGTELGYKNTIKSLNGVKDSIIIVPGDPLLIRDGTQTTVDDNGNRIISKPGSGGKIDIYILGEKTETQLDSFIYSDKSNTNNATNPKNDYILGQRGQNYNKNTAQKRLEMIAKGNLPYQPISRIISVSGSISGANFVESYTDIDGQIKGNFELVKDTGDFSGSCFGLDKIKWISNKIELKNETIVKGLYNGIDALNFSDVEEINLINQKILVLNENPTVNSSNRSRLTVKHTPIESISRVVNLTSGERYTITNTNPDGGDLNLSGSFIISGSTLPTSTDILQVDYIWIKSFDNIFDFDNLKNYNVLRQSQDSIDWGFSNLVDKESCIVKSDGYDLFVEVSHPIYNVLSAVTFKSETTTVINGTVSASEIINNIINIKRVSDGAELYMTSAMNGSLTGTTIAILPSDTVAANNDDVIINFNSMDIYSGGSFLNSKIILPENSCEVGDELLVSYISNVNNLIPETEMSLLPATKYYNKFLINNIETGEQPTSSILNKNLRSSPSYLRLILNSSISNGTISIIGKTIHKAEKVLVTVTTGNGYKVDLSRSIKNILNSTSIPDGIKIAKIYKVERVETDVLGNIIGVENEFDIVNYKLLDNSFDYKNCISDSNLSETEFSLPQTENNTINLLNTGDLLRITFYYSYYNNSESIFFSRNGEQISKYKYATIDKIYVSGGFRNTLGQIIGTLIVRNYNQPVENSDYLVDYNYIGPKENERITITYDYNKLISDATNSIESVRPVTADVIVKEAKFKEIDVYVKLVLLEEYVSQQQTVIQDATNAIISFLTASSLGTTIDASDITNTLYTVNGVDRVTIMNFSYNDSGNVLSISAAKNEYLKAGTVLVETETR